MMKRDLKADLAILTGDWGVHENDWFRANGVEIAEHAIERALEIEEELTRCGNTLVELTIALKNDRKRADKAEALARELVAALQGVSGMLDYATGECRCGVCEYCNVQKRADKALAKAKEVLGDE